MAAFMSAAPLTLDFGQQKTGANWRPLNDGVMGGLSRGQAQLAEDMIRFEGAVSLANNGGFASLRSPFGRYDLSGAQTVELRLKAVQGQFALTLETERVWFRPYYKHSISLQTNDWEVVRISLEDFHAYQVGRKTAQTLQPTVLDDIIRVGLVTDMKQAVDFAVEIDYIKFE